MKLFILMFLFPMALMAVELAPVGYNRVFFHDDERNLERYFEVWYPVEKESKGTISSEPWDIFPVAVNAPIMSSKEKRAVIVLSHGATGEPHQLSWLTKGLVERGYIVIAMTHIDRVGDRLENNYWQRARDVNVALNLFLKTDLASHADVNKIGFVGYSLGGTTGLLLEGAKSIIFDGIKNAPNHMNAEDWAFIAHDLPYLNHCKMAEDWKDERIKAFVLLAPAWPGLFSEESFKNIIAPTLVIAPDADTVVDAKVNGVIFAKHIPKCIYNEVSGGHFVFLAALDQEQRKRADPDNKLEYVFTDALKENRAESQTEIAKTIAQFFDTSLSK